MRTDGAPELVEAETEFVPDEYPVASDVEGCPSPETVKVMTETDGDAESVCVAEPPGADVPEPESGETGIVSTVAEPDGSVTVRRVAEPG